MLHRKFFKFRKYFNLSQSLIIMNVKISSGIQTDFEEDTMSSTTFSPTASSTIKEDGNVNTSDKPEDYISITKTRACQTQTFTEQGTQTELLPISTNRAAFLSSLAVLSNRCLHASYWYFTLSAILTERGMINLKKNIKTRQSLTKDLASRVLKHLVANDKIVLADISKPDFDFAEATIEIIVDIMKSLDKWLLTSIQFVLLSAKVKENHYLILCLTIDIYFLKSFNVRRSSTS